VQNLACFFDLPFQCEILHLLISACTESLHLFFSRPLSPFSSGLLLSTGQTSRDFPHPLRLALGPIQPPTQQVPDLSREVKRPLTPHLAPTSTRLWASWPVLVWNLHTGLTSLLLSILLTWPIQFNRIILTNESVNSFNW
jgi:hypothetical protein